MSLKEKGRGVPKDISSSVLPLLPAHRASFIRPVQRVSSSSKNTSEIIGKKAKGHGIKDHALDNVLGFF